MSEVKIGIKDKKMMTYIIVENKGNHKWEFVGLPFKCLPKNAIKKASSIMKTQRVEPEKCIIISRNDCKFFEGLLYSVKPIKYK